MAQISVYTRKINKENYPFGLAHAIHFLAEVNGAETCLNKNYGILFVKGEISGEDTIIPLGADKPGIYRMPDGSFGICARRIRESGEPYEPDGDKVWAFTTKDFIKFDILGLIDRPAASETIEVGDETAKTAIGYWAPKAPDDDPTVTKYNFPLAKGFGDPVLFHWEGKWYFISTSDNTGDVGIYVREADTIPELFAEGVTQHLILPYDEAKEHIQTFWAPEFHVIGGELYILFALSGKQWGPQCHVMRFKRGGSITDPDSWDDPVRVVRKDGSPLSPDAISLDMTFIRAGKGSYMVWSYRKGMGTPLDTGSMLYIASIDEREPWKLTSEPVLLTRPLYGWENVEGTVNNEGPYTFVRNNRIYMTYSGGAANSYTYAVGLFTADIDADLLDLRSWTKSITPVLTFYTVPEFGPGHNSFFTDEHGNLMIAYHGETEITSRLRCDMIRRVCFKPDGTPFFV